MKKISLWILAAILITGLFIAEIESVSSYNVEVTWTIRERIPTNHVIKYDGKEFPILAGQEAIQTHELYGGAHSVLLIYTKRGWGIDPAKLTLDGQDSHMYSFRLFKKSGTLKIFGLGRRPAMHAEIQM